MKKRNNSASLLVVFLMVLSIICGGVFAYMFRQTEYKNNEFTPASVSCKVHETKDVNVTEKTSIKVENTGNIEAYLRVRFVSYWVQLSDDGSPEIVGKASKMPSFEIAAGWMKGSNDTYYYLTPVAPGKKTAELLSSKILLSAEDGYYQVVEVFAEAIQSKPDSTVSNTWHVELNSNGSITAVP